MRGAKQSRDRANLCHRPNTLITYLLPREATAAIWPAPVSAGAFVVIGVIASCIRNAIGQPVLPWQSIAKVIGRPGLKRSPSQTREQEQRDDDQYQYAQTVSTSKPPHSDVPFLQECTSLYSSAYTPFQSTAVSAQRSCELLHTWQHRQDMPSPNEGWQERTEYVTIEGKHISLKGCQTHRIKRRANYPQGSSDDLTQSARSRAYLANHAPPA